MKKSISIGLLFLMIILASCKKDKATNPVAFKEFTSNFQTNAEGWTGDFADYPNDPNVKSLYELQFSYSTLPSPLNATDGALKQSGNNRSDDLFMFVKRKFTGLAPNTSYKIDMEVEIATNAASGGVGAGGPPGEAVYIKAGATTNEPLKVLDKANFYIMNIDKGLQSKGGSDMKVIGDFANGTPLFTYKLKVLKTTDPISVKSNSDGEFWIIVGTDSGYESVTTIYYNSIKVNAR